MRPIAEASLDQARKAFEKLIACGQATAGSLSARMATVKDLSQRIRLHREYVQAQTRVLAGEMGQIMSRTAMDAAKSKM